MLEAASWLRQPSSPFELRHASTERPFFVNVPPRRFLVIEGAGPRHAEDFTTATRILRLVDQRLLSRLRRDAFTSPTPPLLEVISTIPAELDTERLEAVLASDGDLRWAQLLEIPAGASDEVANEAIDRARAAAGRPLALVHLAVIDEGPSVQLLSVREVDRVPSILRLFEAIAATGLHPVGRIHELQLNDPAKVPPDRTQSIVRLPLAH